MTAVADRLYRRLGRGYLALYTGFELVSSLVITLATCGLFALYERQIDTGELWELFGVASCFVVAALGFSLLRSGPWLRPLLAWIDGDRSREAALAAWRAAAGMPREFVVRNGWQPFAIVSLPIAVYAGLRFDLPWYGYGIVVAGCVVAIAYAAVLHFFSSELALRPVLADTVRHLPADFHGERVGVPLRWKLLGALPIINIITGVMVSGLSVDSRGSLSDLGIDVIVAVIVAFTVSLELTLLLTKSVLRPVGDLLEATERVKQGDLSTRVPVLSGDEMGALAGSFNEMLNGLEEREALREAFGRYVDPEVAERVIREGTLLEGDEVEVSVMFVDIRDFTAYAERASAREAVTYLNDFFGVVVPVLERHGGHANKFVGDGVLGVFGAPERRSDHADRAVAAGCEIVEAVERRFGGRLKLAIGINSGPVIAGSVGGGERLEFTVIGDAVNVAARVEALAGGLEEPLLVTEATRCLLERELELEERGAMPLKGKSDPVPIYAPRLLAARPRQLAASAGGDGSTAVDARSGS